MKSSEKTIKLYPIYHAFSADLVFFIPIDTLFLTYVKGLDASQYTFMGMLGLLVCIFFQKPVVKIAKKIGNTNSVRLGMLLLLISTSILCFSKTFYGLLVYCLISDLSVMFSSMMHIMIKHDLQALSKTDDFVKTLNLGNVMYGFVTLFTTLVSGYLYNYNNYLPLYITLVVIAIMFGLTFTFVDEDVSDEVLESKDDVKFKKPIELIYILLSSSIFVSVYRIGQNNSKLFLQYDLEKLLSLESVTLYLTYIVFISRIVRIVGNMSFTRLYRRFKLKIGNVMAILHFVSYSAMVLGHFINNFTIKLILMAFGYFIILGIRDPYQTYIEDLVLRNTPVKFQQQTIVLMETYRRIAQLIINVSFILILLKYELVVTQVILVILTFIEIFINFKMVNLLKAKAV